MTVIQFETGLVNGIFDTQDKERELIYPRGTMRADGGQLLIETDYTSVSIPLQDIRIGRVTTAVEGIFPFVDGRPTDGAVEFTIFELK